MRFIKYDLITFDDDSKVLVLETVDWQGKQFLYVCETFSDDPENLSDVREVMVVEPAGDSLTTVIEPDILSYLLPIFHEKIAKACPKRNYKHVDMSKALKNYKYRS